MPIQRGNRGDGRQAAGQAGLQVTGDGEQEPGDPDRGIDVGPIEPGGVEAGVGEYQGPEQGRPDLAAGYQPQQQKGTDAAQQQVDQPGGVVAQRVVGDQDECQECRRERRLGHRLYPGFAVDAQGVPQG